MDRVFTHRSDPTGMEAWLLQVLRLAGARCSAIPPAPDASAAPLPRNDDRKSPGPASA
jgi:hypothetical protein